MKPWLYLVIAGVFEVVWAVGLRYTQGFTRWWPSVVTGAAMLLSFQFLSLALRSIPVGTGYAVWTGIGAAGTAIVGMLWLNEPRSLARLLCLMAIVGGVIGLRLASRSPV